MADQLGLPPVYSPSDLPETPALGPPPYGVPGGVAGGAGYAPALRPPLYGVPGGVAGGAPAPGLTTYGVPGGVAGGG